MLIYYVAKSKTRQLSRYRTRDTWIGKEIFGKQVVRRALMVCG
jgi:hypothetical protein